MRGGSIVRHSCGRLVIYGQRCVCESPRFIDCDCTADGNDEHEGEHCRSVRRSIWNHAVNWSRDRARRSP